MTALYNNCFSRFGLPIQDKNFGSKLFSELRHIAGIEKSRTTPVFSTFGRSNRKDEPDFASNA